MEAQPQDSETAKPAGCFGRGLAAFRGFVSFLLIVALLAFVCILLLKSSLNNKIREIAENQLRSMLADASIEVSLDSAVFYRGRGIEFSGLRMTDGNRPLLFVDKFFVESKAELWDLIRGKISPSHVTVTGLKLHLRQESEGELNLVRLIRQLPKNQNVDSIPTVAVRNSMLAVSLSGASDPMQIRVPEFEFASDAVSGETTWKANLNSEFFRLIQVSGEFRRADRSWHVTGNASRLLLKPDVYRHLPQSVQKNAIPFQALNAAIDFDFDVTSNDSKVPDFIVVGEVKEGRVSDERLPFPIHDLSADFVAKNSGVVFENLIAESSLGTVHLDVKTDGISSNSPIELVAKVDPLLVDGRLEDRLPENARAFLRKFSPEGNLKLNARLTYRDGRWVPDVRVDLLDLKIRYHKCPYPLSNAQGYVTLDSEKIEINVKAMASGRPVLFRGKFLNPGPDSVGTLRIDLDGTVPIDMKVFDAMEQMPDVNQTVRKFRPRGRFGFFGEMRRVKSRDGSIEEEFFYTIPVSDTEVIYELFPLPFSDVSGVIEVRHSGTTFRDFKARNVGSTVYAKGSWDPTNGLDLFVDSYEVELNSSLKSAVPPAVRNLWDDLHPSGLLHSVNAHLKALPGNPLDYVVDIKTRKSTSNFSMTPTWFPYELEKIESDIAIRPGGFLINKLKGVHRRTTLAVQGDGVFDSSGWVCNFRHLYMDKLKPDRDFTAALPKSIGDTIESVDLKGLFNLRGSMSFKNGDSPNTVNDIQTTWDLTADVDNGAFLCGIQIEDIYGAVRLTGKSIGERFESTGGMKLDSLVWNEIQFTDIHSPIYLDSNEARLGIWATSKRQGARPDPMTCKLFRGTMTGNAVFYLHGNQPFEIQAVLQEGDLGNIAFELAPEYDGTVGRAFAGIRMVGNNTGSHSLRGNGEITLVDSKISEVPVILGMLKLLSVRQLDRTLFNESKINFRIQGEHVFFDELEFLGDAISLKGNGEMDFDQNIDLQFYTAVGRDGFRIPVVSKLLGAASQQILVIDVDGTTQKPVVKKNFFKMLNKKLKENIEDLEDSLEEGTDAVREVAEKPFQNIFR